MNGIPLLIVDDNPLNAKLATLVLEECGFTVRSARDAAQALEVLDRYRPRAILMDLQMPGMDGFALTRRLKSDEATRDIVIIALTAYAMKGDETRARDAGCDGYIAKPINTRALGDQILEHLDRARERDSHAP